MDSSSTELIGREDEQRHLELIIGNARNARAGSLLVVGEPGIGKSALLQDAVRHVGGTRVLRVDGYQSEATIPFAALQRLVLPLGEFVSRLPERLRRALDVAVGGAEGDPPDRFLVGVGLLDLLGMAAADRTTICMIDDAHLIDAESLDVLAFVARRLIAEPLALIFASRDEEGAVLRLSGVEQVTMEGLRTECAVRLLSRGALGPLDPAVAAQIAHATGGNPLALTDLAHSMSPDQLSELALSRTPMPVGQHLEAHYSRRLSCLDEDAQTWLLLAAADSTGALALVTGAATAMGLDAEAADRAEGSGLVEIGASIRFRHQLVASAVYNAANGANRRQAHKALAAAADELDMVELQAWHASHATVGPDPLVGDQLELVADIAARKGGLASRARVLLRSAELTPEGALRDARRVGAAEAALGVGAAQVAAGILDDVHSGTADPVTRGRVILARADLAIFNADGRAILHGCADLVSAADLFHGRDQGLEQTALIRAFEVCMISDRLMQGISTNELGERLARAAAIGAGPSAVVLEGLSSLILRPYDQAVPMARAALDEIMMLADNDLMRMGVSIAALGTFLWDERGRSDALARALRVAREAGALQVIDALHWITSLAELSGGSVTNAERHTDMVREVRRAMGYDAENVINAAAMAWTGSSPHVVLAIADGANAAGFGGVGASAAAAVATRELAEGKYRDAYRRLKPLIDDPFLQVTPTQFPDFVEAAARSGHDDDAATYAERLTDLAAANGSEWCRGVAARAAGLASDNHEAEKHYRSSLDALELADAEVDLARSHLVYGEWLRRARRRRDAGHHLMQAIRICEQTGAEIFLSRARRELEASGVHANRTTPATRLPLTNQELSVAERAASGQTNAEIAAAMFISPSTVDYHLRKVFQKLGISSRRQLAERLQRTV